MAYQRSKNDPYALTFNPRWRNHPNFSCSSGPNVVVPNQYGGFPTNFFQPRSNYQGFSNGPRQPIPLPPLVFNAQSQASPGYSELDKHERRIRSDTERMLRENNETILKAITKQFS